MQLVDEDEQSRAPAAPDQRGRVVEQLLERSDRCPSQGIGGLGGRTGGDDVALTFAPGEPDLHRDLVEALAPAFPAPPRGRDSARSSADRTLPTSSGSTGRSRVHATHAVTNPAPRPATDRLQQRGLADPARCVEDEKGTAELAEGHDPREAVLDPPQLGGPAGEDAGVARRGERVGGCGRHGPDTFRYFSGSITTYRRLPCVSLRSRRVPAPGPCRPRRRAPGRAASRRDHEQLLHRPLDRGAGPADPVDVGRDHADALDDLAAAHQERERTAPVGSDRCCLGRHLVAQPERPQDVLVVDKSVDQRLDDRGGGTWRRWSANRS